MFERQGSSSVTRNIFRDGCQTILSAFSLLLLIGALCFQQIRIFSDPDETLPSRLQPWKWLAELQFGFAEMEPGAAGPVAPANSNQANPDVRTLAKADVLSKVQSDRLVQIQSATQKKLRTKALSRSHRFAARDRSKEGIGEVTMGLKRVAKPLANKSDAPVDPKMEGTKLRTLYRSLHSRIIVAMNVPVLMAPLIAANSALADDPFSKIAFRVAGSDAAAELVYFQDHPIRKLPTRTAKRKALSGARRIVHQKVEKTDQAPADYGPQQEYGPQRQPNGSSVASIAPVQLSELKENLNSLQFRVMRWHLASLLRSSGRLPGGRIEKEQRFHDLDSSSKWLAQTSTSLPGAPVSPVSNETQVAQNVDQNGAGPVSTSSSAEYPKTLKNGYSINGYSKLANNEYSSQFFGPVRIGPVPTPAPRHAPEIPNGNARVVVRKPAPPVGSQPDVNTHNPPGVDTQPNPAPQPDIAEYIPPFVEAMDVRNTPIEGVRTSILSVEGTRDSAFPQGWQMFTEPNHATTLGWVDTARTGPRSVGSPGTELEFAL